jgi:oligopeptide transport system permease protein
MRVRGVGYGCRADSRGRAGVRGCHSGRAVILAAMAMQDASIVAAPGPIGSGVGWRWRGGGVGLVVLLAIVLPCVVSLPWSVQRYRGAAGDEAMARQGPTWSQPMGRDALGRSVMWRCLLGGAVSLGIGASAAVIAVGIGVAWGAIAGYVGGRVDSAMMRIVDVLYGLPYVLLVVLVSLALQPVMERLMPGALANLVTLLVAIGGVSWLTMSRVIRGQVLSLRSQPFVEAARACGVGPWRMMRVHLLPNLVGPIVVYATLTVPQAILQESFLSFLGIGVRDPLPSWGNLAAAGVVQLPSVMLDTEAFAWWLLAWPCLLLAATLLALNFLGDALRAKLDPRSSQQR